MSTSERGTRRDDERGSSAIRERSSYDVLDVKPGATREEIEAAYRRALRIIEGNSLGGYLMLDPEARESAKREVERAFQVLTNPQERARVDRELAGEPARDPQRDPPRAAQADKGGRRGRRRRKREAARRARAERQGGSSSLPTDAPTLPMQPALDDAEDERVTVITSAEAEPIVEDEPLDLPPAQPAAKAPAQAPAPQREEPPAAPVVAKESPPPLPSRPKKPLLRFLSPVVESAPPPKADPPPLPRPTTTTPPREGQRPTTPPARAPTEPPRRPWLYSDAGAEAVAEPRVIARTDDCDEHLTLPPESEINGGTIRRLREARGITLEELAEQTHIRKSYLKAIEEQNLDELPASVYLRGFLTQIARVLKVDKKRLAEGYMTFVGRFRKK